MSAARTKPLTSSTQDYAYLSPREDMCLISERMHGPTVLTAQLAGQKGSTHTTS